MAARGDHLGARERFDAAVALRDDQPEIWIARARSQLALGDYGGAFGSYSSALDLDRTNREALDAVGQIALLAGKSDEAERIANQILTLAPDDSAALYVKGSVLLQRGRLEAAAATIDQGLRMHPNDENLLVLKSRLLTRHGDLASAERILRPVFDRQSANPLVFDQLADVYGRQFDGRQILLVRARAARARSDDAQVLYEFGKQLLASGVIGEGIRVLESSIKQQKKASNDRSILLAIAESNVNADALSRALVAQRSLSAATRLACARYAILADRPSAARSILLGVSRDQRTDDWFALVAYLLARQDRTVAAASLAAAILQKDARSNFALASRALTSAKIGLLDEALRDARLAVSDAPNQVEPVEVLATIFTLRGDAAAARATYNEAFNRNRDNILFLRALVLSRPEATVSDHGALVRDFTARNPTVISGWVLRRSMCIALRDMPCVARAGVIAKGLTGAPLGIRPTEERVGPPVA